MERADPERLLDFDLLVISPNAPPIVLPRHHALDGHQRLVGAGHIIGGARHRDAVVEERAVGEHHGYHRLPQPVTHRRMVVFNKSKRCWFIEDRLTGEDEHDLAFRFHIAPGLGTSVRSDGFVEVCDKINGSRLLISASELNAASAPHPELENRFSSRDYGAKVQSLSVCWAVRAALPFTLNFVIIPIRCGEDESERLSLAMDVVT